MRAVRVHALGEGPRVDDVVEPDPVDGDGSALVRVAASAVGHLDRTVAAGRFAGHPELPYVPGVEGAGHVVRSQTHAPGTPVRVRGAGVGTARDGTAAELAVLPDAALHPVGDDVDLALAACAFSPAASAWLALHDVGALTGGERVLVTGAAGAVGSLAVQLAADAGAAAVAGLVSRREREPAVPDVAVALSGDVSAEQVHDALGGPVDLLVDTVGGPGLADRLLAVAPGGRAVLVGYTAGPTTTLDITRTVVGDVRLLPLNLVRRAGRAAEVGDDLLRRLADGALTLGVERFDLTDAEKAWEHLASGAATGRVVLTT